MHIVFFLFLRRMRAPLIVLISAYTISITGLMLIPGQDDQGNPWQFDFFHAFYFVSFMGSTIGFGEVPYEFTVAQRMWTTLALYLTVIAWLYAIGNILTLIQDAAFKRALIEQRFTRSVRRLDEPFYLICGYGETGKLLVRALNRRQIQSVVIDENSNSINALALEDLSFDVPGLCADVGDARHLLEAGLCHPKCVGVVALTDSDEVNVKIAVTSKLLNPSLKVISRAEIRRTAANLASFNTDHIINPFDTFADHLAMTLRIPSVHLLYDWLIRLPNQPLHPPVTPPRGTWVVCGYGRFGRAVNRYMQFEGIPTVIVEPRSELAPEGAVIGYGTEAVTLREAGVEKAVGIIAGTEQDADNLSIIMTARELNPQLYLVARQNRSSNDALFEAAHLDLVMQSNRIIVWRILSFLTEPLLGQFLRLARHHNDEWAMTLLQKIRATCGDMTPQTCSIGLNAEQAPAVHAALCQGRKLKLWHILMNPQDRTCSLPAFPLLIVRGEEEILLPDVEERLYPEDQLLICIQYSHVGRITWILANPNVLTYIETGEERPDGYIWQWLSEWRYRWRQGRLPYQINR
jgi:Trk K+ transport system NAD-binding subunit